MRLIKARMPVLLMILILFFTGCANQTTSAPFLTKAGKGALAGVATGLVTVPVTGLPGGVSAVLGGTTGAFLGSRIEKNTDSRTLLSERLTQQAVRIIYLGQQLTFVLDPDRIFYEGTSNIRKSEYVTLSLVAAFIRQFKTSSIQISAFTNQLGDTSQALALTDQQAQHLLGYLGREGIGEIPLMTGLGYGSYVPIAQSDFSEAGKVGNRRIEIKLQWVAEDE